MRAFKDSLLIFALGFVNICEYVQTEDKDGSPSLKKLGIFYPEPSWNEEVNIAEGNRLFTLKKFNDAFKCYNRAIELNGEKSLYYVLRGKCTVHHNPSDARDDFLKAFQMAKNHGEETSTLVEEGDLAMLAHNLLHNSECYYLNQDHAERTIWCFDELVKRDSLNVEYILLRGRCYAESKMYEDAIADLKQAVQLDPENKHQSQTYLRKVLFNYGKFGEIMKEALSVLDCPELLQLGNDFRFSKKDLILALHCYDEAIERKPETSQLLRVHLIRAKCFEEMGQWHVATADYKKRVELMPQDIKNCWYPFTSSLFSHERFGEFSEEVDKLSLSNQELIELADLFLSKENFEHAIRIYSEAIRRSPAEGFNYKLRADCFMKLGKLDLAIEDLKIWIQQNLDNEEDRIKLKMLRQYSKTREFVDVGLHYIKKKNFSEANKFFIKALEINPHCELCLEKKGICEWKLQNYDAAIIDLKRSADLAPWDLIPKIDLCEVYVDSGKYDLAEKLLEELKEKLQNIPSPITNNRIQDIQQKKKILQPGEWTASKSNTLA